MSIFSKRRALGVVAAVIAIPLILVGCSNNTNQNSTQPTTGAGADAGKGGHNFALVTANVAGDSFWQVVKTGAEAAAKIYGDKINYQSDPDVQKQSQFIEGAVASKADGIIVQLANADGLKNALADATKAGIPIVSINSGAEDSAKVGAIAHVGQTERVAGQAVGNRLNDLGLKNVICVIHEVGNIGLEDRCGGIKDTFKGTISNVQVDIANVADAGNTIKSKLLSDTSIDGVVTLNAQIAMAAEQARDAAGSNAKVGTFDLSTDVLNAVKDGKLLFAVDQQEYLQGYIPVVLLELYINNRNTLGGGMPVLTGPSFVTQENAAQVLQYAQNGTR